MQPLSGDKTVGWGSESKTATKAAKHGNRIKANKDIESELEDYEAAKLKKHEMLEELKDLVDSIEAYERLTDGDTPIEIDIDIDTHYP